MSNIVEFPDLAPAEGYSETYVDKLHAKAFRDMEGKVTDLERMGSIAESLLAELCCDKDNVRSMGLTNFAVQHLADMLRAFHSGYHRSWYNEKPRVAAP